MSVIDAELAFTLRRSLVQRSKPPGYKVEQLPEYSLVYLIGVTHEQLKEALRTTCLKVDSQYGAITIKPKPTPPESA